MRDPKAFVLAEVCSMAPPRDLKERNWLQLMLSIRVQEEFKWSIMQAVELVAPIYGERFPH